MAQHNCDQDCPKLPGSHPVLLSLVIVSPVIFSRGRASRGQQKLQPKKCEELALLLAAPGAVDLNPAHLHKPPVFSWDQKKATANSGPVLAGTTPQGMDAI